MPLFTINLTDEQLKVVLDAVALWQTAPVNEAFTKAIVSAIMTKDASPETATPVMDKAESEAAKRRYMSMSIQMRVMEVLANPKEHVEP